MQPALSLLEDVITAAKRQGADAADAIHYGSTALSISCRMGKPEGLERAESVGLGLRVFVGGKIASVSASDLSKDTLNELVERAVAMARLAPADPYSTLAPKELLANSIPELDLYDPTEPSAEWLQEQCKAAEDAALATKGITNSEGADAAYGMTSLALATSNGFSHEYKTSNSSISVSVLAGEGTNMERDYDFTSARFVNDLENAENVGKNAAKRALARMGARKMATVSVPVVFDPRVSKSLVSAFASAVNGSGIARGTSFLKDAMETPVFASSISIIDDPHRKRGLSSRPFDGEGVANSKHILVDKGVLKTWLLDMRTANKLGLKTTGHAARGLSSPPSPSSTNLYMEAGLEAPGALMRDIDNGFYVTEVFGMGINLVTGDYSQGASGFWIEKGERAFSVSEMTIAGKLRDMFAHATPANDLEFRYGVNAPTVRIDGMTVAGS